MMLKHLFTIATLLVYIQSSSWNYVDTTTPWTTVAAICGSGKAQSPIDFVRTSITEVPGEKTLKTDYWGKAGLKIKNTGHGLQVDGNWGKLFYKETNWYIKQFHFHQPSEHTFDLMHYDMEMHMVHYNCEPKDCAPTAFLVLGFFFMLGDENPFLNKINYTKVSASHDSNFNIDGDVDLMNLIGKSNDKNFGLYTYDGSFTTPPCTEGVNWLLFREPQTLSQEQWDKYANTVKNDIVYSTGKGTFRPAQKLWGRDVKLEYFSIKNGEQRFTQAEIFGISIGSLGVLLLIGLIVGCIIYNSISKSQGVCKVETRDDKPNM